MVLESFSGNGAIFAGPWLAPLRYEIWKKNARRDFTAARDFSQKNNLPLVDIFKSPLLNSQASTTLFILGSGWSINTMSDKMFAHIGSHQSVGVNFWFFHDFVPTTFSFDAGKVPESEKSLTQESLLVLGKLFSRRELINSKPKILFLRPYQSNTKYLVPTPPSLRSGAWVSGRANFLSTTTDALGHDLRIILKAIRQRNLIASILPDNGASIVRLIFLGLAQGFQDIVLVGVDLDSRPHFWFAPEYSKRYPEQVNVFPPPDGALHGTTERVGRAMGNLEFIKTLQEALTYMKMGQLWASAPTSQLSSILPQYCWPN